MLTEFVNTTITGSHFLSESKKSRLTVDIEYSIDLERA